MALLSKINIGGTIYDIKDAAARAAIEQLTGGVDSLGTAAEKDYADAVANDNTLPTGAAIVKYVGEQIADINSFEYEVVEALPTASADTMYTIYLVADAEGANPDAYEEWITIKTGDAYSFEKIGDTNIGLNGYVPTTRTVAGLALSNDISAEALKTALGLGALAYKSNISGTVECITAVSDIDYTPAGEVSVALKHTNTAVASAGKFTPAGNVTGTTVAAGDISVGLGFDGASAALTQSDYTPAGTVTVTLSGNTFNAITDVGSQAKFTEGEFTPATLTHNESAFAVEGIVASVGTTEEDGETLILAPATTANASLISGFSGGAKAADTFVPNSVATFAQQTVGVQAASFEGTTVEKALVTGVTYDKAKIQAATFTGKEADITASFTGTEGDVAVSGNYAKAEVEATSFTGAKETLKHNATKGTVAVNVTVS
jgi:hypothetical protein